MYAKKLTNLSDGKPNEDQFQLVDCGHCDKGKIGEKNCPICGGVGQMTKSKKKRMNKKG